ncbi:MAG: hypothetical protein HY925_02540, partial [Elusimicrobia bacterium]|nr:hypothetical protein [Elusimicrobiota bacterium]
ALGLGAAGVGLLIAGGAYLATRPNVSRGGVALKDGANEFETAREASKAYRKPGLEGLTRGRDWSFGDAGPDRDTIDILNDAMRSASGDVFHSLVLQVRAFPGSGKPGIFLVDGVQELRASKIEKGVLKTRHGEVPLNVVSAAVGYAYRMHGGASVGSTDWANRGGSDLQGLGNIAMLGAIVLSFMNRPGLSMGLWGAAMTLLNPGMAWVMPLAFGLMTAVQGWAAKKQGRQLDYGRIRDSYLAMAAGNMLVFAGLLVAGMPVGTVALLGAAASLAVAGVAHYKALLASGGANDGGSSVGDVPATPGELVTLAGTFEIAKNGSANLPGTPAELVSVYKTSTGFFRRHHFGTYVVRVAPGEVERFTAAGFSAVPEIQIQLEFRRVSNINGWGVEVNGEVHRAWKETLTFSGKDVGEGLRLIADFGANPEAVLSRYPEAEAHIRNIDILFERSYVVDSSIAIRTGHTWTDDEKLLYADSFRSGHYLPTPSSSVTDKANDGGSKLGSFVYSYKPRRSLVKLFAVAGLNALVGLAGGLATGWVGAVAAVIAVFPETAVIGAILGGVIGEKFFGTSEERTMGAILLGGVIGLVGGLGGAPYLGFYVSSPWAALALGTVGFVGGVIDGLFTKVDKTSNSAGSDSANDGGSSLESVKSFFGGYRFKLATIGAGILGAFVVTAGVKLLALPAFVGFLAGLLPVLKDGSADGNANDYFPGWLTSSLGAVLGGLIGFGMGAFGHVAVTVLMGAFAGAFVPVLTASIRKPSADPLPLGEMFSSALAGMVIGATLPFWFGGWAGKKLDEKKAAAAKPQGGSTDNANNGGSFLDPITGLTVGALASALGAKKFGLGLVAASTMLIAPWLTLLLPIAYGLGATWQARKKDAAQQEKDYVEAGRIGFAMLVGAGISTGLFTLLALAATGSPVMPFIVYSPLLTAAGLMTYGALRAQSAAKKKG